MLMIGQRQMMIGLCRLMIGSSFAVALQQNLYFNRRHQTFGIFSSIFLVFKKTIYQISETFLT
jgi:hypothetical protein